jgi:hypothetical protein
VSRENVRAFVVEAPEMTPRDTWPNPDMRLVNDDRPPAPKLDADALPAGWETWITAEATARACPRDYVAAGLIGAASAWIGNGRRIAGTAAWIEPPHLWFALIGAPSTGKTPALRPMKNASRKLERDSELTWRDALASYERDAEAASAADKTWREQVGKATKENSTPPDRPKAAETPKKPPRPRVVTMDTSTEELQQLLADNARGLLHLRDELAGWLGSFDRYGGKGSDRGFYLECWNGDDYVSDRVKFNGVPLRIKHAALAIVGGMVPDRLRETLSDADDGLPARFIFIWPEPVPIAPLNECSVTDAAERRDMLEKATRRLRTLKMGADDHGEPTPIAIRLDDDAFALFDEQRQEAMHRARRASGLAGGWHGKNPGRLLRLALVFELLAWAAGNGDAPEPASVSADAVVRAGGFIDYTAAMFERMIAGLAIGRPEADAAEIARHVLVTARAAPPHARLKPLNERSLYQRAGFSWARDAERRAEALAVMSEALWLRRPQTDGHGRPRGDWQVNPRIFEEKR